MKWDLKRSLPYYIFAIVLIAVIVYYLNKGDDWQLLLDIHPLYLLLSLIICSILFSITGLKISFNIYRCHNVQLSKKELFFLPMSMNLFSYLFPFKGGMLYSIYFLKKKYRLSYSTASSISIFNYLTTLTVLGFAGVLCLFLTPMSIYVVAGFVILALNIPLTWLGTSFYIKYVNDHLVKFPRIASFFYSIHTSLNQIYNDKIALAGTSLLSILSVILYIFWYYNSALALQLALPFHVIVLLTVINNASIIFRFTPGNLGLTELLSGALVKFTGGDLNDGILIVLVIRLTSMILSFSIGAIFALLNMKAFSENNS